MSVNNLEDGVTHEFRIYGRNNFGTIERGDILELTTSDIATVETGEASNVNPRSATLNGELKDLGSATLVEVGFEYDGSKQTSFTEASSPTSFSETISGLNQNQFYNYTAKVREFPDPYRLGVLDVNSEERRAKVDESFSEPSEVVAFSFNDDGTKVFVASSTEVYSYNLGTAYSLEDSVTFTGNSLSGVSVDSIEFSADGTNLFVSDSSGIRKYDLSSAYSLSGSPSQVNSLDVANFSFSEARSIRFGNGGNRLFVFEYTVGNYNSFPIIYQLDLTNPHSLSNPSESGSIDVNNAGLDTGDDFRARGIEISPSGDDLFLIRDRLNNPGSIYRFSLSTSFDVTTASFENSSSVSFFDFLDVRFGPNGRYVYFAGGGRLSKFGAQPDENASGVTKTLYTPFKDFNIETKEADNVDSTSVRFNGRLDSLGDLIGRFSRRSQVADADLTFQYRDADSTPQPYELGTAGTFRLLRFDEGEGDGFVNNFEEFDLSDNNNRSYLRRVKGMSEDGSKVYRIEKDTGDFDDVYKIHQFSLDQNYDIRTVNGRDVIRQLASKARLFDVSMIRFYESGSVATVRARGRDSGGFDTHWFYKFDLGNPYDFVSVTDVTETSINEFNLNNQNLNLDGNDNVAVFFSANGGRSILYNQDRRHFQLYDNSQNYVFDPSEQNLLRTFDFGLSSMERGFYSNGKLYVIDEDTLGERVWHQFSVPTDFDFSNTQLGFQSQVPGGVEYDGFFRVDQGTYSGNGDRIVVDGGNQIISEDAQYTSLEWNSSSRINENNINTDRSINEDNLRDGTNFEFKIIGRNNQGDLDEGSIKTFVTNDLPTVTTSDVTALAPKSVTLNGNLEDLGGEPTVEVGFEFVKDDNGNFSDSPNWQEIGTLQQKNADGPYSQTVTVEQDFFYLVRAKVETGSNTYYGKAVRFQTPIKPFTIQTKSADLDGQKATIEGRLDSKGRRGLFEKTLATKQIQAQNAYVTFRYREQGQEEAPYDFRQGGFIGQFDLSKIRDNDFIDNAQDRIRFGGFNPAGDKVYLFTEDSSNNFRVGQYTLSENYDIASVNGKEAELLIDSNRTYYNINPLRFYQNGSVAASTYRDESFKIDLNTPYDLRDGGSVTARNHSTRSGTLVYSEDGSRALFQSDSNSQRIRLFENLNTNYVLDVEEGDNSTREFRFPETDFSDFNFHYELISGGDDKLYVFPEDDDPDERVLQYSVSTRFDLTTRSFEVEETIGTPYLGQGDARRKNYKFEDGGRRMYSQRGEFFDLRWNVTNEQARRPDAIRNYDARTKTLENGKTYEYQATGLSSGNFFDTGSVKTFSIPDAPSVSIDSVSGVERFAATFSGSVENLGGNSSVDVGFEIEREPDNARFSGNKLDVSSEIGGNSDIFFKPDGTRLFVGDTLTEGIKQYDLSTAFDVTTATLAGNFDLDDNSQFTGNPFGIHFKPDGKKLFVIDAQDTLQSYELSAAWDITTISSTRLERNDLIETANDARALKFKPDGTRFYVLDDNRNVYEYRTDQPWDISGVKFESNQNIDISSNEFFVRTINNDPRGLEISNDGTRLYAGDTDGEDIFVYKFRSPWNVQTLVPHSYVNLNAKEFNVSGTTGISVEENGERFFVSDRGRGKIYEFEGPYKRETAVQTVTSAGETFEVSVSGLAPDSRHKARAFAETTGGQSLSVNSESFRTEGDVEIETGSAEGETEDAAVVNGTVWRSDFDEVDVAFEWRKKGNSEWNRTYERTFLDQNSRPSEDRRPETPSEFEERIGDLGSRRLVSEDVIGGRFPDNAIAGIKFNSDGTKAFVLDDRNNSLVEFELSTGYDFSTASLTGNELLLEDNTDVQGFNFDQNGETLLTVGGNNEATTYKLSTGYDITTAKVDSNTFGLSTSDIRQGAFIDSGKKLLTLSENREEFEIHRLQEPYNVENASLISDNLLQNQVADSPRDFLFNGDGTKLIVVSRDTNSDGNRLFEFNLSTPYDLTTANRTNAGDDLGDVSGRVRSVATNGDGTKFFIGGTNGNIYRYTASTGFDLSTVSFDSVVYNGREKNGIVGRVEDVSIGREGSSLFVFERDSSFQNGQRVSEMPLGTDYDISTRQQVSTSKEFVTNNISPEYIEFTDGGRRMYVLNDNDRDIEEFELSTPWDVTTISRVGVYDSNDRDTSDVHFGDQGKRAYITRRGDDFVQEYYLNESYQLSNFGSDFVNTINTQTQFPSNFLNHRRLRLNNVVSTDFNEDGTRLYYANANSNESRSTIAASNLDRPWATTTHNRSKWAFSANMREYEFIKDIFVEENDKLFAVSNRRPTRLRQYDISPLGGSETYEYRAVAIAGGDKQSRRKNINRLEVFGDVKEFTTAPDVAVSTNAESSLEPQSASFNGEVTDIGSGSKTLQSFENSSVGTDVASLEGWTVPEDANAGWEVTDKSKAVTDGSLAIKSKDIGNNEIAAVEKTFAIKGGGEIKFDWNTSSGNSDFLKVFVNGNRILRKEFERSGTKTHEVDSPDSYTIRFEYDKDFSGTRNDDTVYIDNLQVDSLSDPKTAIEFRNTSTGEVRVTQGRSASESALSVQRGAYDVETLERKPSGEIDFTEVKSNSSFSITEAKMGEAGRHVHVLTGDRNQPTELYQYELESAYDLSTATYQGKQFELQETAQGRIWYGDGGRKAYFVEDSDNQSNFNDRHIRQYDLDNQYDFSGPVRFTGRLTSERIDDGRADRTINNIRFNGNGTTAFVTTGRRLVKYSMNSPYDINGATQENVFNEPSIIEDERYWEFVDEGDAIITRDSKFGIDSIVKHELNAPYDVTGTDFFNGTETQSIPVRALGSAAATRNFVDGGRRLFKERRDGAYAIHNVALQPDTEYSYKAVIRTTLNRNEGSDVTFTTPQIINVETKNVNQ